jgi:competence protein ComFC
MRCITCESFSWQIICKTCQSTLLTPTLNKRQLSDDFFVYSFYSYEELQDLLNSKYEFYGDKVFNILAQLSFAKFAQEFKYEENIISIPIDDHTRHEFSQSAILARHTKSTYIKPTYSTLKATNKIKYAGKDLEFRQKNPRKFIYSGKSDIKVILIDDLVTTGLTLIEARKKLNQHGCETLFALTLCDAKF